MEDYSRTKFQSSIQAPPTVMKKSLMVNCIINSMEVCDMAIADIPVAFL